MTEPLDARERRQLCDLLQELGPDAPTLCAGWTTGDLAAHLVIREHFHHWTARRMAAEQARGWSAQLARLRGGPPLLWRTPGLRVLVNGVEFFIHHEDVRRANGLGPRPDLDDLEALAWRTGGYLGRRLARQIRPFALELVRPDGRRRRFGGSSSAAARLQGRATELALYLSGRRSAAQVSIGGDVAAVAAITRADVRL